MTSLREEILKKFRQRWREGNNEWINSGQVARFAESINYKGSNAERRCRELQNEGLLERTEKPLKDSRVKSVWYKYSPTERDLLAKQVQR